ncbi:hypothetical protein [Pseudomonas fluorescens]|uniref:hypothetical protein n=1 Tax=Pseudomonas fluorescens TaxID=294 RepID=UPI00163A4C0C|nr:hypothetical protein [Pseudomonas fluorescens]
MIFPMEEVPAAANEDDGHASLFFCEGVVVGGGRRRPASWSGFFVPGQNGVKREKVEVMHKKI